MRNGLCVQGAYGQSCHPGLKPYRETSYGSYSRLLRAMVTAASVLWGSGDNESKADGSPLILGFLSYLSPVAVKDPPHPVSTTGQGRTSIQQKLQSHPECTLSLSSSALFAAGSLQLRVGSNVEKGIGP